MLEQLYCITDCQSNLNRDDGGHEETVNTYDNKNPKGPDCLIRHIGFFHREIFSAKNLTGNWFTLECRFLAGQLNGAGRGLFSVMVAFLCVNTYTREKPGS
jgi:hypothetical protein